MSKLKVLEMNLRTVKQMQEEVEIVRKALTKHELEQFELKQLKFDQEFFDKITAVYYLNDGKQDKVTFSLKFIDIKINFVHLIVIGSEFIGGLRSKMKRSLNQRSNSPNNILFIAAIFLPASIRETSLGDMEETYKKDVKRFGVKKAKWLMFKDIVVSNYPIMKEFARKSAIKIIKFAGVYEAVRRIIG
jgi:hypothetical protein